MIGSQSLGPKQRNMFASQLQQIGLFARLGFVGDDNERASGVSLHHDSPWNDFRMPITLLALLKA
jgi:hypothetical protein